MKISTRLAVDSKPLLATDICILNSWLLAPGSWLLAPGSWLLAPGS